MNGRNKVVTVNKNTLQFKHIKIDRTQHELDFFNRFRQPMHVNDFHQHEVDDVKICILYPTWDSNTHLSRKQKEKRKGLHCTIEGRGQEPLE
jgi:hypothetical protein